LDSVNSVVPGTHAQLLGTGPLFRQEIGLKLGLGLGIGIGRDRVRVRVRVWIVWYMDAQTAARLGIADLRNSGPESG